MLNAWFNGGAVSVFEARCILGSPFFAGFLLFGFMGLRNMWLHFENREKVVLGVVYVVCSYFGIEVLFKMLW